MDKEILNAVIEMVKQGGTLAVWGIFVYLFMQIIKVIATGGVAWLIIKTVCATLVRCWEISRDKRKEQVSLISDRISQTLSDSLERYNKSISLILESLDSQLRNFKENLKS